MIKITSTTGREFKLLKTCVRQTILGFNLFTMEARPMSYRQVPRDQLAVILKSHPDPKSGIRYGNIDSKFSDGTIYHNHWAVVFRPARHGGTLSIGCSTFDRKTTAIIRTWALGGRQ